MAILGTSTKGTSSAANGSGVKGLSKFTLASAQTLTELHCWAGGGSGSDTIILCIYNDVAGIPTTRLAFTSPLAHTGSDVDLNQTGFSVALAAGDYWLGYTTNSAAGVIYMETTGGTSKRWASGTTFNPPATPCETAGVTNGTRNYSVWGVVGAAASAFVPRVIASY